MIIQERKNFKHPRLGWRFRIFGKWVFAAHPCYPPRKCLYTEDKAFADWAVLSFKAGRVV